MLHIHLGINIIQDGLCRQNINLLGENLTAILGCIVGFWRIRFDIRPSKRCNIFGQAPSPELTETQYPFSALGRLETPEQFGDIILKTVAASNKDPNSSPKFVRLKDVGRVELGALRYDMSATVDGLPSVALAVFQLPGTNALDVAAGIKKKIQQLAKNFPPGMEYSIVYDTTPFISESIAEVFKTLRGE